VSPQCEIVVGPQLSHGMETVRRLQQRDQQCRTNRTNRRNMAQTFHGIVLFEMPPTPRL
jgi:hypothetical protein